MKEILKNSDQLIDSAVETMIAPMEVALGPVAIPARKAGELFGDGIIKFIDKIFE